MCKTGYNSSKQSLSWLRVRYCEHI